MQPWTHDQEVRRQFADIPELNKALAVMRKNEAARK